MILWKKTQLTLILCKASVSGYVGFGKTICCSGKFFRWLNDEIIFTCIQERKIVFDFDPVTLTWFQLDGEPVQIEVYNDPEVIQEKR